MTPDTRIDVYLAKLPDEERLVLQRLRRELAALVPEASETIAYGIPTVALDGRPMIGFAARRTGWSLYPFSGSFLDAHPDAIRGYERTKGSLHIPWQAAWPQELVEQLVIARREELSGGTAG